MSRSRKKLPIHGMTVAGSDKLFKQREHRRERRIVRASLETGSEPPPPKEFGNPALSEKDGKGWMPHMPGILRK